MASLPVTFIGGFFGSGKTSLLHHLVSEQQGGYLAVLVENPGPLNLDAKAVRGLCGAMQRTQDTVLELPDGDEKTQTEWIAARLKEFSDAGRYERVLVEVAGTSNAARLAQHLPTCAELNQVICLVDALDYFQSFRAPNDSLRAFQNEQIAGATLLVLNKCDQLDPGELALCSDALRKQSPGVPVFEVAYGEVPLEILTQHVTAKGAEAAIARLDKLTANAAPIPDLSAALYRVYRPFHPGRFWEWFNAEHQGLLRIKGIVWLATRSLLVGGISRTRWQNGCGVAGIWWAALPREEWPQDTASLAEMQEVWQEPYGDRRQELVLLGDPLLLAAALRRGLDACLLTDEEFARPFAEWASFSDPFPQWDVE